MLGGLFLTHFRLLILFAVSKVCGLWEKWIPARWLVSFQLALWRAWGGIKQQLRGWRRQPLHVSGLSTLLQGWPVLALVWHKGVLAIGIGLATLHIPLVCGAGIMIGVLLLTLELVSPVTATLESSALESVAGRLT